MIEKHDSILPGIVHFFLTFRKVAIHPKHRLLRRNVNKALISKTEDRHVLSTTGDRANSNGWLNLVTPVLRKALPTNYNEELTQHPTQIWCFPFVMDDSSPELLQRELSGKKPVDKHLS